MRGWGGAHNLEKSSHERVLAGKVQLQVLVTRSLAPPFNSQHLLSSVTCRATCELVTLGNTEMDGRVPALEECTKINGEITILILQRSDQWHGQFRVLP